MALRVLAIIREGRRDIGYRLYDENSGAIGNFKTDEAILQLRHYGCSNAIIESDKLVGLESGLDRFSVLDSNMNVIKDGGLVALNRIVDGRETVGYTIVNVQGEKLVLKRDEALQMMNKFGISNAIRVTKDGKVYLRGIKKDLKTVNAKEVFKHKPVSSPDREVNKKQASIRMYTFVEECDKTKCIPEVVAIIENLTKYDLETIKWIEEKQKGVNVDMLSNNRIRLITSADTKTIISAMQQILNALTKLDVQLTGLVWVTGVNFRDDEGSEGILQLKAGDFSSAYTERYHEGDVSALDNVKACGKDIKQVLSIINNWGKASKELTQEISKDTYWFNSKGF